MYFYIFFVKIADKSGMHRFETIVSLKMMQLYHMQGFVRQRSRHIAVMHADPDGLLDALEDYQGKSAQQNFAKFQIIKSYIL